MPMRTFSPMTDRTDTSTSSPIMMLWLDLRVKTSIRFTFLFGRQSAARPPDRRFAKHSERTGGKRTRLPEAGRRQGRATRRHAVLPFVAAARGVCDALVSRAVHASEIPAPEPQPDPRLGAAGPYRRLGGTSTRGQRARHRTVQASERARERGRYP